jgi:hypothetical protein
MLSLVCRASFHLLKFSVAMNRISALEGPPGTGLAAVSGIAGTGIPPPLDCKLTPNAAMPGSATMSGSRTDASAIFTDAAPLRTLFACAGAPLRRAIGAGAKAAAPATAERKRSDLRMLASLFLPHKSSFLLYELVLEGIFYNFTC